MRANWETESDIGVAPLVAEHISVVGDLSFLSQLESNAAVLVLVQSL